MTILEPQQYNIVPGDSHAARALFMARLKHLISLENANIQRIEEVGTQLGDMLRNDFGLG